MSTLKNSLPDELIALWSPENEIEESHLIAVGDDSDENNAITMDGNAEDTIIDDSNGYKTELSDREKLKAAYALNLCTVSVSQIVKDRDQYIMDQEYDAILNKLNLEEMPKDAPLREVLEELLDVITHFRVSEIEKQFVEKEYQLKKPYTCYIYKPFLFLGKGLFFGDFALDSDILPSYLLDLSAENLCSFNEPFLA